MAAKARPRPTGAAGSTLPPNPTTTTSSELVAAPAMCTHCDATEQPLPENAAPSLETFTSNMKTFTV